MASVGKLNAAKAALAEVKDGQVLGIGTGSTVAAFIELLGRKVKEESLEILCIPTSYQSAYLAAENGLSLTTLDEHPDPELAVDGADEIDGALNLIKGGGAALTKEKVVDSSAKRFVVIADCSKLVGMLGRFPLPLEVLPYARLKVMKAIREMGGEPKLRDGGDRKDGPLITDNGNFVVDAAFNRIEDPKGLEIKIKSVPGVVEVGLFVGMAHRAYIGNGQGAKILDRA
ncbi:MAG: ribose-5-phosphate isomerase RpiA [Candidatus Verstraetearchaeota archaeon]|nr:ribose-5-phosphate isomerase RpiA [Candidatus Verstraetearchaeota archaeon]